jgi:hypothetical protein
MKVCPPLTTREAQFSFPQSFCKQSLETFFDERHLTRMFLRSITFSGGRESVRESQSRTITKNVIDRVGVPINDQTEALN